MDWLSSKIDSALAWLGQLAHDLVSALFNMVTDALVGLVELFLNAVLSILNSLTPPAFLQNGLQGFLLGIDPSVLYFLSLSGFTTALGIVGAGFTFRMLRKLFTLGQW